MSYQVLARKWRPAQFADVVGQAHVLTALENALEHNRLHHAYLFSGTRGVGKTTIARIFAKGLNCEQGVTAHPCGQCATCKEIDEGRFVDLLEIDAASRTKVEDTRELLDNVQYKPARGRFKVYLIDEVHMLSRHSFNALLKTLEEPPEYVKFILATTDPQKLPVTILSRCLQFHLKHLDNQQIQTQLEKVLTEEQLAYDIKALSLIARAAEGSMRDALSLTDQAIALGNGNVEADKVSAMLGTLDTDQALMLLEAVAQKQAQVAIDTLHQLAQVGVEWDGLLRELAAQLHRIAMSQVLPESQDESSPDFERVLLLSKLMTPQDVQLCYQIALQGRQDLAFAPDGRTGLEMVLLRMLAFRPMSGAGIVPQAISVPTQEPIQGAAVQPMPAPQQSMEKVQALRAQVQQPSAPAPAPAPAPQMPSQPPVGHQVQGYTQPEPQNVPPVAMQQSAPEAAVAKPRTSGLLAARNQLRSQTKRGQTPPPAGGEVKKSESTPAKKVATSVLDRIATKHNVGSNTANAMPVSNVETINAKDQEPEEYQWRPMLNVAQEQQSNIATKELKQALEHEKTPEMMEKLVVEAAAQDNWAAVANELEVGRLIQQLALNSVFEQKDNQVTLLLRSSQKHLDGARAREQLTEALQQKLGCDVVLHIELNDEIGTTPLELREAIYQQKLQAACQSLQQDQNVNFICQRFGAVLDDESIRPI
ncbi:DNA polymerase III subunit gamma/tau [Photobacterium damselae]|uniref:DNA polymerase III subunit gamma/tau n=1 Tax=Photobacterium damselae TaxID=38293 RepID=UPI001302980C|nr:DNA polymerase III subunit gamma/tau [Photobacterium damselae]